MRTGLKLVLSALLIVSAAYNVYASFHTWRLPFDFAVVDRHTLVIAASPGVALPAPRVTLYARNGDANRFQAVLPYLLRVRLLK